jgi:hypothetical protein
MEKKDIIEQREQERTERGIGDRKEGQKWSRRNRRGQNEA